jgi:hypothetical protein
MEARRILMVVGMLLCLGLVADQTQAACKTCSRGQCQTAGGGWSRCTSTQNSTGNWTCTLSGSDDCSTVGHTGGGETCSQTAGPPNCQIIIPTFNVYCEEQTVCTGGPVDPSCNPFPCAR